MNAKKIFSEAINKKASDVHLVVGLPPILRIDGQLYEIPGEAPIKSDEMEREVFGLIDEDQKNRFLVARELDFGLEADGGKRLRVNIHFEKDNVGLVARIISDETVTMENIDMPQIVYKLLGLKQGLILVTGPTGCGKSTTLAAMINYINDNYRYNIITFEDPIEYIFKPNKSIVMQRQLGRDMLSFADGLKHALRQDPNVIMVGEMRDLETISTTITLAETGHLVLATLHTYSAAQTVERIIDIFPPHQQTQVRTQLSMTLAGVISQRLLPNVNGGRVAAREVLINTPAVANLIREKKIPQIRTVIETSMKDGMSSMDQDIKRLYKLKMITKEIGQTQMDNPTLLDKFDIF